MSVITEIDAILDMYITESTQLIEQLEAIILESEESNQLSENMVHEIFRIMHTIKGSSSMMQYDSIAVLAHSLEDIFSYIREKKPQISDFSILSDLVLDSIDFIKVEIEKARNQDALDGEANILIERAKSYLSVLKDGDQAEKIPNFTENQTAMIVNRLLKKCTNTNYKLLHATIHFEDNCDMENVRAFQIVYSLKESGEECLHIPENLEEFTQSSEMIKNEGFELFVLTDKTTDEILDQLNQSFYIKEINMSEIQPDSNQRICSSTVQENIQGEHCTKDEHHLNNHHANFINVNVTKLDELMDLVGELVIAQAMVTQNPELQALQLEQFEKAARHLQKITNEIQDQVMNIRMVPLTNTFHKMHRVVRDMCKKLGKNVHLELTGEETEMDKSIIEHISDPLMHLVRNALDHGMESSVDRVAKGKNEMGTITLEAAHAGGEVIINVKDDGRGLDRNKILEKAFKSNLLLKNSNEMSDKEVYNLIFLPGFSTKEKISEFSGRGVGMDVVMQNITAVGGSVSVDSVPNSGTTVSIRIPLTLAIIDGMNVRVGNSFYTLPLQVIKESFRPSKNDIITDPDGNEMIMIRGQCYPIIRLHQVYTIHSDSEFFDEGILVMVELDGRSTCLFVDELLGQQQVVVKSLPLYIKRRKNIRGISGCTLLGDGSISLILDVSGFTKI